MTPEKFKEIKNKTNNNMELFFKYYLEEGGKNISFPAFNKYFQTWLMFNNYGDSRGGEIKVMKWLEQKHK